MSKDDLEEELSHGPWRLDLGSRGAHRMLHRSIQYWITLVWRKIVASMNSPWLYILHLLGSWTYSYRW